MVEGIVIEGHLGSWYSISETIRDGKEYLLLESEQYGEDAPHIITDKKFNVIIDDVYNGFDELEEL